MKVTPILTNTISLAMRGLFTPNSMPLQQSKKSIFKTNCNKNLTIFRRNERKNKHTCIISIQFLKKNSFNLVFCTFHLIFRFDGHRSLDVGLYPVRLWCIDWVSSFFYLFKKTLINLSTFSKKSKAAFSYILKCFSGIFWGTLSVMWS